MSKQMDNTNPSLDASKGLWTRCDQCGEILYIKHLRESFFVCLNCHKHLPAISEDRLAFLLDDGTWQPMDAGLSAS